MNTSCCTNPIRINTLLIKNRIVFPAMCTKYAGPDGGVTERMLRYYEERAKGGAGLVTIEASSSTAGAPRSPNFRAMPCLSYPPSPA